MSTRSGIADFLAKFSANFSPYVAEKLAAAETMAVLEQISDQSGKAPSETVLVFLYALRHIYGDKFALRELEGADAFDKFVGEHRKGIVEIGVRRRVQGNLPERGLPILEVFFDHFRHTPDARISVLELGASFGMIGRCLLAPDEFLRRSEACFKPNQQLPGRYRKADAYLGLDLDPPDADWLVSCIFDPADAERLEYMLGLSVPPCPVLKGPAQHFLDGEELSESVAQSVRKFIGQADQLVVLTSFMLYQVPDHVRQGIRSEVTSLAASRPVHWLKQDVDLAGNGAVRYYLEWNGTEIAELSDDRCTSWNFLD